MLSRGRFIIIIFVAHFGIKTIRSNNTDSLTTHKTEQEKVFLPVYTSGGNSNIT